VCRLTPAVGTPCAPRARALSADDTDAGTASCGGFNVDVKALVCGDGTAAPTCLLGTRSHAFIANVPPATCRVLGPACCL